MVSLKDKNRIMVPTGGIEDATYIFPSFGEMAKATERFLKRKVVIQGTEVSDRSTDEGIRLFDLHVTSTEGLPARNGEKKVVEMSTIADWVKRIPVPVKLAAASIFDELSSVEIQPTDVFGDPVVVECNAIVGKIGFEFQPMDDMADELKTLMSDRIRQKGRRIQDRSLEVRKDFFRKTCNGVIGFDVPKTPKSNLADVVPLNWIVSAVRVFERQEALSDADLGN